MKRSGEFRNTSKCETVSHKPAITTAATWTSNSLLHFPHWFRSSCRDFLSFADFTDAVCHSSKKLPLLLGSIGIVSAILNLFTAGGQTGVVSVTVQSLSVTWLKVWSATKLPERSYFAKKKKKKKKLSCVKWADRSEGERASVLPYFKFNSVHSVLLCLKHYEEPEKCLVQIIIFAVVFVSFWEYRNCVVETTEVPQLMASFPPPG